jgi:NitT/TauT family transport system permease protein
MSQSSANTRTIKNNSIIKPYYVLSAILLFVLWLTIRILSTESQRQFLFPSPQAVALRLIDLILDGSLFRHISVTLIEMGLGLSIGTVLAIILGYAVVHSKLIAYLFEPMIVISQAVPIVALAPILTVWFGPGLPSKVAVCCLIVFFPILVNVINGLSSINPQQRAIFLLMQASRAKTIRYLEIPAALPSFLAGLKIGSTLTGMGAVVGEFVASTQGLGYLVKQGQNLYDLPMMFAAILTLMSITILIYFTMLYIENKFIYWSHSIW